MKKRLRKKLFKPKELFYKGIYCTNNWMGQYSHNARGDEVIRISFPNIEGYCESFKKAATLIDDYLNKHCCNGSNNFPF